MLLIQILINVACFFDRVGLGVWIRLYNFGVYVQQFFNLHDKSSAVVLCCDGTKLFRKTKLQCICECRFFLAVWKSVTNVYFQFMPTLVFIEFHANITTSKYQMNFNFVTETLLINSSAKHNPSALRKWWTIANNKHLVQASLII